jgi:hypothetical protein
MRRILALAAIAILAGCASSRGTDSAGAPPLQVTLAQIGTPASDMYFFRGPINVQYELTVKNPTSTEYTLRRLDIQSVSPGAYSIRTGNQPITYRIPPNGTTTIHLSTWGTARGGFLRAEEPVSLRVIAQFDAPGGKGFQKVFTETLGQ